MRDNKKLGRKTMSAFVTLSYIKIAMPLVLSLTIWMFARRTYPRPGYLLLGLLIICYGTQGIALVLRVIVSETPLRPELLVASEYVMFVGNLVTIIEIVLSSVAAFLIAKFILLPRWSAFLRNR